MPTLLMYLPLCLNNKILEPSENDVLFGKGYFVHHHPGNCKYRSIVIERKFEYKQTKNNTCKHKIAQSILMDIENLSPPGRFLSLDEDGTYYEQTNNFVILTKIKSALRV